MCSTTPQRVAAIVVGVGPGPAGVLSQCGLKMWWIEHQFSSPSNSVGLAWSFNAIHWQDLWYYYARWPQGLLLHWMIGYMIIIKVSPQYLVDVGIQNISVTKPLEVRHIPTPLIVLIKLILVLASSSMVLPKIIGNTTLTPMLWCNSLSLNNCQ